MLMKLRNRKGFTLVELMIVVAIIGILAAIAIPNFLNFRLKAKTSEAKSNLGAIRSTEVAYYAEWNAYIAGNAMDPVPVTDRAGDSADGKVAWDGSNCGALGYTCTDGNESPFSVLGFAPEGSVFFSYELDDNASASTDDRYDLDGFTAHAFGDLDGDGAAADFYVYSGNTEILKTGAPF